MKIEGRINKRFCYYTTINVLFYLNNGKKQISGLADDDESMMLLSAKWKSILRYSRSSGFCFIAESVIKIIW